jgi:hypothetical protein
MDPYVTEAISEVTEQLITIYTPFLNFKAGKNTIKSTKPLHECLWCDPANAKALAETMRRYRFFAFPRTFGNPRQVYVSNWAELVRHIQENDGINTCFTSHNSYGREEYNSRGKIMPKSIYLSKLFYDLDGEGDLVAPYMDVCRLKSFSIDHRLAFRITFSGSKGFHFYHQFKSNLYSFDYKDGTDLNLIKVIRGIQYYLQDHLSLETLDPQSTGEPKKLCRIPFTWHVSRKGVVSDYRCVPIPAHYFVPDKAEEYIKHILNIASGLADSITPPMSDPQMISCTSTDYSDICFTRPILQDFITLAKIDFNSVEALYHRASNLDWDIKDEDARTIFGLLTHGPHRKPCLVAELMSINPHHKARVAFALFCKQLGYSRDRFAHVYGKVAKEFGYIDYEGDIEGQEREDQIDSIYDNPNYTRPPSCSKIKSYGLCLGPKGEHNVGCDRWRNTAHFSKISRTR